MNSTRLASSLAQSIIQHAHAHIPLHRPKRLSVSNILFPEGQTNPKEVEDDNPISFDKFWRPKICFSKFSAYNDQNKTKVQDNLLLKIY